MTPIKFFDTRNLNGLTHNDLIGAVVQTATQFAQEQLQQFAQRPDFREKMTLAFGISPAGWQDAWVNGLVIPPKIEILSRSEIKGANGAFAGATNRIYLAQEFLSENTNNLDAVVGVLLEEYGHFVDYCINDTDSPGDEGAIFSALVRGESLSTDKLSQLKVEDDKTIVVLNGSFVEIEKSSNSITSLSGFPSLGDYDNDGDLDILYAGSAITQDLQITNFFSIYRNNGNGFSEAIIDNTSIGWNPSFVQWSDYDNDGDLDLVAYGVDAGNNGIIRLYTNNNGTYSLTPYDEISILASEISVADNFTVSINDDVVVIEGELATFTVTLEGDNTQPVTVNYSTSNNTAIAGLDYEFTSGILTFNPGDKTKTITVQTLTDSLTESDETFFVNLSTTNANIEITDNQGIATIQDINYQNNPGILNFSNPEFRVNENGEAIVAVTVTRSGGSDGEVSATITLSNGTATAPDDYDNTPITFTFAAGDTTSKIIEIPIVDDFIDEPDETINLTLSSPIGGATFGSQTTASLVIVDNDTTSVEITAQADLVITKTASADSVQIGDSLTYTITITNNGTIESQGINLTETLGDGVTFVSASLTPTNQSEGTLNFDLGNLASSATTTVEITVTAPSTTGVISSRSQILSDTFDPNANNDFVILDTTVVEEVVANNAPVATDDIATTQEDTAVVINVLNNDSDLENNLDVTTVEVATNPNNGTVNVNSTTGEITYTPTTNFSGNDSFTYTVKDSSGVTSNPATVNIIVNSVPSEVANFNNSQVFNVGGNPGQTRQLQLSFISQDTNFVNEIGFFIADDDQGTINGITPDNPNYLTTALTNSQVIFSALANNVLQGVDFTRQLNLAGSDSIIFYLVQNSTTETILADLTAGKTPANVLFAIPSANSNGFDPLQVSDLNDEAFTLSWKDTLNGGDNVFNDLVLNVQVANETSTPPGTGLQGKVELIDLRNLGTLEASFKVASEAAYNNTVGWYLVDDETGLIGNLKPGDAGYAEAAIAQRSVTHFTRDGIDSAQLHGLLAPYLIANSSRESFLANNPNNTLGNGSLAYFAFMGANPDGVDHVRQLGDNTFGFEDLFNGGDKDYNDIIVQVNFT